MNVHSNVHGIILVVTPCCNVKIFFCQGCTVKVNQLNFDSRNPQSIEVLQIKLFFKVKME